MPNSIRWLDGRFNIHSAGANIEIRVHSGVQEYVFQTTRHNLRLFAHKTKAFLDRLDKAEAKKIRAIRGAH